VKDAGKTILGLVLLSIVLAFLYLPFGRTYIPSVAHFFSERVGIWDNVRSASYEEETLVSSHMLEDTVRVFRDENGIPHIFANSDTDALKALGYVSAQDRLFQMMWQTRSVAGQLHQWMGDSYLERDKSMLSIGLNEGAWRLHNRLGDNEYDLIQSYQRGVNQFINNYNGDNGTLEFTLLNLVNRYWRPVDCLRILNLWGYRFANPQSELAYRHALEKLGSGQFRRYYQMDPNEISKRVDSQVPTQLLSQQYDELQKGLIGVTPGSNSHIAMTQLLRQNKLSRSIGGNLQSSIQLPHSLYPVRIVTPNRDVFGYVIPGTPFFVAGAGQQHSWILSGRQESVSFNAVSGQSTRENSYTLSTEDGQEIEHKVLFTENGAPVWSQSNGAQVAQKWDGIDADQLIGTLWDLSSNAPSADVADIPGYNLLVMNREGNSEYIQGNKTEPIQKQFAGNSQTAIPPVRGEVKSKSWQSIQLETVTESGQLDQVEDLGMLLMDTQIPQQKIKPYLLEAIAGKTDRLYFRLNNALEEWDYSADRNSGLPVFWEYFMRYMNKEVWDELGELEKPPEAVWVTRMQTNPNDIIFDRQDTKKREDVYDLMRKATEQALSIAQIEYGNFESWNWGSLTTANTQHATGIRNLSTFASYTINREGFEGSINELGYRGENYGVNWRFVSTYADPDKPPLVQFMWTGGSAENPFSLYHHNGVESWNNRNFNRFDWTSYRDTDAWKSRMLLTPAIK
jgi:acyl-homoserine lactone acylase PvdQ